MLTVVLATRNRARILLDVLESFCHLQPPPNGWKLVVVDNGSTDETSQVIRSFAHRLPLHSIVEPKLGKNSALNAGLRLVEGDLTVLTDDDVFPHADWLIQLRNAADAQPEYSIFGGAVVPRWEVPPPNWIEWIDLGPTFTVTPASMKDGPLAPHHIRLVFGPNMAIRTNVFQSGTRFDAAIGPRGTHYPMGSETELLLRLDRQGHRAWHVQSAVVEHFIRKEQLDKNWIMQRAIRFGRGCHRMEPNTKLWAGIPRHLFRDLPKDAVRIAVAWATFRRGKLFQSRWHFNYLLGIGIEARIMARDVRGHSASGITGDPREPSSR